MAWIADFNPPEAYDEVADALYQDALAFTTRKYESIVSEIPGLPSACEPALLDALRTDWIEMREEAKRSIHEWSRKGEAQACDTDATIGERPATPTQSPGGPASSNPAS
jgi:hypothetical protein